MNSKTDKSIEFNVMLKKIVKINYLKFTDMYSYDTRKESSYGPQLLRLDDSFASWWSRDFQIISLIILSIHHNCTKISLQIR